MLLQLVSWSISDMVLIVVVDGTGEGGEDTSSMALTRRATSNMSAMDRAVRKTPVSTNCSLTERSLIVVFVCFCCVG